jgi:cyclase
VALGNQPHFDFLFVTDGGRGDTKREERPKAQIALTAPNHNTETRQPLGEGPPSSPTHAYPLAALCRFAESMKLAAFGEGEIAMRRVGPHSYTEVYFAGCNPSFVETSDGYVMIDSPQQPIDAVRWRERMEDKAPIRYLINTEPHGDHISGNAYFTNTKVVGQVKLQECFERYLWAFGSLEDKRERFKETDPDSVWLVGHPDYPAVNPPTLTFDDTLTLNVGNHTFNIIHMPGHTAPQTSVLVPEEGVVFTGDNVFHKCRSWLQECDPWEWFAALKSIEALDVETIVPGHGEPCGKAYLKEQGEIVENWVGFVERFVDRGVGPDEILRGPIEVTKQDPYPIGQRLFIHNERLTEMIVRNLHKRILDKKRQATV